MGHTPRARALTGAQWGPQQDPSSPRGRQAWQHGARVAPQTAVKGQATGHGRQLPPGATQTGPRDRLQCPLDPEGAGARPTHPGSESRCEPRAQGEMLWSSDLGAGSLRTLLPPSQPPSPAGRGVLTPAQASGANRRGLGSPTWAPSAGATLQRFHKTREGFGLYHQILFTLWRQDKNTGT